MDKEEFVKGTRVFEEHEKRDAMYKVATFLVSHFWGNPKEMADGLGVLLLTWNQGFYRYGSFDFDQLEDCIKKNFQKIASFRNRDISSLSNSDKQDVLSLFDEILDATFRTDKDGQVTKSPVSAAKALHVLAPGFFPLWDDKIAKAYDCYYALNPGEKYFAFSKIMKEMAKEVKDYVKSEKTILKLIDEYNYSKYTKHWI